MRSFARTLAQLALAALATSVASAQSFNIDGINFFGNPTATYGAGAAQPGFWTNVDCWGGLAPQALTDINGNPTLATLDHNAGVNFAFDNAGTFGDDQALLDDGQDTGGPASWVISGLDAGDYKVYAYAWAPDSATFIVSANLLGGSAGPQNCGGAWSGAHAAGTTYVVDQVNGVPAGGSITIDFATVSGFGTVNGLQIVKQSATPPVTVYCTAGTSTNGCNATMSASSAVASISAGPGSFVVTASGVEGQKLGLVFYGVSGQAAAGWGSSSSFLCVKAPTQRLPSTNTNGTASACNGSLSMDFFGYMSTHPFTLGQPIGAGQVYNAQAWYRDPPSPKTTHLSNGIEFTLTP